MSNPDFIIVGGGHNTLGAACYLALCGQKVLVLEKNAQVGGGVISEEVTLPGFRHDSHASGVVHLQGHPIVTADELGLMGRYGLKFAYPEASYMTIFNDGTSLTCYADLDRACADIAKLSEEDAASYRALVGMMDGAPAPALRRVYGHAGADARRHRPDRDDAEERARYCR